jgi:hypothetical protein
LKKKIRQLVESRSTNIHTGAVRGKSFSFGKQADIVGDIPESLGCKADHARSFQEVVCTETTGESRTSASRQYVRGTCYIITNRDWAVVSDEYRTSRFYLLRHFLGVCGNDFHVLGGD